MGNEQCPVCREIFWLRTDRTGWRMFIGLIQSILQQAKKVFCQKNLILDTGIRDTMERSRFCVVHGLILPSESKLNISRWAFKYWLIDAMYHTKLYQKRACVSSTFRLDVASVSKWNVPWIKKYSENWGSFGHSKWGLILSFNRLQETWKPTPAKILRST